MGPMLNAAAIERVAVDLLSSDRGLLRRYLDEIVRQDTPGQPESEIDRIALPKSVRIREAARHFADDQLPAIVLVAPGTEDEPRADGSGVYLARLPLAVTAIVKKGTEDLGREIAGILAQASAAVLLHGLPRVGDDRISSVTWGGYYSTDTPDDTARTLHVCVHQLTVTVNDVMNTSGLPNFPGPEFVPGVGPAFDPGEYGTVLDTEAVVDKEDEE